MAKVKAAAMVSKNPATEEILSTYAEAGPGEVEEAVRRSRQAFEQWRRTGFSERSELFRQLASRLRSDKSRLAGLMTAEMGKPISQAEAEVEKCAWNCEYYAENAEKFLSPEKRPADAAESYIQFLPIGPVLAIMPWNFPFWQVIRFAAPALMAGNTAILKHASNVPQCALALAEAFERSGFAAGVFQTLLISSSAVGSLIQDPRIAAVTLTGSDRAGSRVGALAGESI